MEERLEQLEEFQELLEVIHYYSDGYSPVVAELLHHVDTAIKSVEKEMTTNV